MKKSKLNGSNTDIETVVLKNFLRVIKDDGTYMYFRGGVAKTGIMAVIIKEREYRDNATPFSRLESIDMVIKELRNITNEMLTREHRTLEKMDKYEHVTMTINHLLHFFMEGNGVSMDKLCRLGETIYSRSCHALFGDSFEDLEEQNDNDRKVISDNAELFEMYISLLKDGKLDLNTTFEDFINLNKGVKKAIKKKKSIDKNNMAEGIMLGGRPDENMRPERIMANWTIDEWA